jgi:hypothetical protein
VGYKYNSSKVLCFVATKNSRSTTPGEPYRARFLDDHDNLINRPVDRPQVVSTYFTRWNGIDKHNQARQFELRLEKAWFHLVTMIIGICITDAWKGFRYAFRCHKQDEEITICEFADQLAFELLHNNFDNGGSAATKTLNVLSPLRSPARRSPRLLKLSQKFDVAVLNGNLVVEILEATVSPLASTNQVNSFQKGTSRCIMDATDGAAQA